MGDEEEDYDEEYGEEEYEEEDADVEDPDQLGDRDVEAVDAEDEEAMDARIKALESELEGLGAGGSKQPGAASSKEGAGPDGVIPGLLSNPALDGANIDLSPTSRAVLNDKVSNSLTRGEIDSQQGESAQGDLKRTIIALETQLDQSITNHRNDVASFRLRDEESQSKLRSVDEQLRAARNHIVDIEARYEELMTKYTLLESQKNQVESEVREVSRLLNMKENSLVQVDDQRKQQEQRCFRLEQDVHKLESEIQSLQWKSKNVELKLETELNEKKEAERVVAKLQTENQDLGLRVMSVTGTTRVQQAEIENLHRDLKLANAEREESIKVAVSKNQLEQERLKLRDELNDAIKKHTLQSNSLNQYKEECNRLNTELSRANRERDTWRGEAQGSQEKISALTEDNHQMKQLKSAQEQEIDRLNAGLINERKAKYANFASQISGPDPSNDISSGRLQGGIGIAPGMGGPISSGGGYGGDYGGRPSSATADNTNGPSGVVYGEKDAMTARALADARSKDAANTVEPSTVYGADYMEPDAASKYRDQAGRPAGGSSPFLGRARSDSPTGGPFESVRGREGKLGPYGKVYEIDDLWNNNPNMVVQDKRNELEGNRIFGGNEGGGGDYRRMNMGAGELEGKLMTLNQERQQLEGILMKYPTNSAGKTLNDRKNKQKAESRLLNVEREISDIRQNLRKMRVY